MHSVLSLVADTLVYRADPAPSEASRAVFADSGLHPGRGRALRRALTAVAITRLCTILMAQTRVNSTYLERPSQANRLLTVMTVLKSLKRSLVKLCPD